jgi:hypothetical protein
VTTKGPKFKGPSCLQGEKPDPHLLKLQGPKVSIDGTEHIPDTDIQVKCSPGTPSATLDAELSTVPTVKDADQKSIEIGAELEPKEVKKAKFKGPSCLQGEKPDPYLLKLQGPKADISTEKKTKVGSGKLDVVAPDLSLDIEKPTDDPSITVPIKTAGDDASIEIVVEEPASNLQTRPKKMKGPSCLQGERPDPYLLRLQGPKAETDDSDLKKSSLKRPSSVKADSSMDTGVSVSAKAPKIDVKGPQIDFEAEKSKGNSTTCWKGSESPDPYLLRLRGPKVDSSDVKTGSLKTVPQSKTDISLKSSSLPVKTEPPQLEVSEVDVKASKKPKGPSCLKGEADLELDIPSSTNNLTTGKISETKKFKMPRFHISSEQKDQANLTPVLGPEGRTTFAIMESPDIDFVTPKLQVTPKLPKANKESTKHLEDEVKDTTSGGRFHFKGFHMKKKARVPETSTETDTSGTPTKRSPFKMPKVSKKKQSHSVTAFPDVDVQFPYIDSSEPQVSVDVPGTPSHLTLSALRRLGSANDDDELTGSKTLPTSRRGQQESVTTSWPKIRSSGGSLGDDVDSAGASPESTLKPKSPSLHGSNVSIKYYFVDTPFSATEIEIPDVSSDPPSQLKLTETSSGIIVMETTHTSVSPHGGDSSALDVDASFSTDSLPLESQHHFAVDSAQLDLDDAEGPPSTTPSPFSTLPAGVSPQHVTVSATNLLQSSHTYKEETIEIDSKTSVSVMAAMGDTEAIKPSASSAVKVSETESDELLDSIKQELEWTT